MAITRAIVLRGAAYAALLLSFWSSQLWAFSSCPAGQVRVFSIGNWSSCAAGVGVDQPTAAQACNIGWGCLDASTSSATFSPAGYTETSGTAFTCHATRTTVATGATSSATGTTGNTSRCVPASSVCATPAGEVRRFKKSGSSTPPTSVCHNSCLYNSDVTTRYSMEIGAGTEVNYAGVSTGGICGAAEAGEGDGSDGIPNTSPVVEDYSGSFQCGKVDGVTVCLGGLADGECTVTSNGWGVCALNTSTRPISDFTSPQAPDNGTPGVPATPDYVIRDPTGGGITGGLYNPTTVGGSTHPPGPVDDDDGIPGDDDDDGECEDGEECASAVEECGVEGKPPCDVKIDEEGTPITWTLTPFDDEARVGSLTEAADEGWLSSYSLGDLVPGLPSSSCSSMTFDYLGGNSFVFPGVKGCDFLDTFKAILGWFLYVFTAVRLVKLVSSRVSR